MSDDFFNKIDSKLTAQKATKTAKEDAAKSNAEWVESVMPKLGEIAEDYAAKCRERGMNAAARHNERSVSLTLRYQNGSERVLVGSSDYEHDNKLSFEEHFPDNDGKRYKSAPMQWYDASNWRDDAFEAKLQKTIGDFVFYADRFGGV